MERLRKFQSLIGILVDFNLVGRVYGMDVRMFQSLIGILVDFNVYRQIIYQ